jgi:hypothetical protein
MVDDRELMSPGTLSNTDASPRLPFEDNTELSTERSAERRDISLAVFNTRAVSITQSFIGMYNNLGSHRCAFSEFVIQLDQ